VSIDQVERLEAAEVRLRSGRVDLVGYHRRPGEVALAADLMDRQLIDVDGIRVVRAADLYVARVEAGLLLVGVDVGLPSLLRRLGPARFRSRPTPERVIDWAAIQPFAAGEAGVRLRRANQELHRLRPADLADLLEELGRTQRRELLEALDPDVAADALEEMESEPLSALLRDAPPEQAAALVAEMEPDEAVEALRELDDETRGELLDAMAPERAAALEPMLEYREATAGGIMTTQLVLVAADDTVATVRARLRELTDHSADIDNVIVVDADGRLVDDVTLFELLVAELEAPMAELTGPPWPVTVSPHAPVRDVLEALVANRRSSIVVIDEECRPIGRILADDLIDALRPERGMRFLRVGD